MKRVFHQLVEALNTYSPHLSPRLQMWFERMLLLGAVTSHDMFMTSAAVMVASLLPLQRSLVLVVDIEPYRVAESQSNPPSSRVEQLVMFRHQDAMTDGLSASRW